MARTIQDVRLLYELTAGNDPDDPTSVPIPVEAVERLQPGKFRIGYYEDDGETAATFETRSAIQTAATALRDAGFEVEPFRPVALTRARELWFTIFVQAGAMAVRSLVRGREHEISQNTREFLDLAAGQLPLSADYLLNMLVERDQLSVQFHSQMRDFPILLAPVCSIPAFPHHEAGWGPSHAADYLRTMTCCQHFNLLGNPAATVPVSNSPEGLPIGLQIVGRPFKEHEVLAVAEILNQQFPWKEPPFSKAIP